MSRYTIAVDFDGVLHSYTSPWVDHHVIPDPPVSGAIEWLNEIGKKFDIAIFSTRCKTPHGQECVELWLRNEGVTADFTTTYEKIPALVYVDDRAWRFTGDNFPSADEVHRAIPWNKVTRGAP